MLILDDPIALSLKALEIRNISRGMRKKTKVVDTKASKGRKIRYETQEKLVGFMTGNDCKTWHQEMIDELFSSLFADGAKIENPSNDLVEVNQGSNKLRIFS